MVTTKNISLSMFRSSSRDCPPQLPPRDNGIYSTGTTGTTPPWSDHSSSIIQRQKKEKKKTGDDPYYFGLSARIPNFVKSRKKKQKERNRGGPGQVSVNILSSLLSLLNTNSMNIKYFQISMLLLYQFRPEASPSIMI